MNDKECLENLAQSYLDEIKIIGKHWGGDIELGAIANIYNLPIRVINLEDNKEYLINEEGGNDEIVLQYTGIHYTLTHNGQEYQISGDNDCLFNACIQGYLLNTDERHQFMQSEKEGGEHTVAWLRARVSAQLGKDVIIARYQRVVSAATEDELRDACSELRHAPCLDSAVKYWREKRASNEASDLPSSDADDAELIADIGEFHSDVLKFLALKLNMLGLTLTENEANIKKLKHTDWQAQVSEVKQFIAALVKPNLPEGHHLSQAHKADISAIYRQKVFSYEMKSAFLPELIASLERFLERADNDKDFEALNAAVSEQLDDVTFRLMDTVVDALQRNLGAYYQHGKQFKVDGKELERAHKMLNQRPCEFSAQLFSEDFQHFYEAMLASIKKEVDVYRETFAHDDGVRISLDKLQLDQKSSDENYQTLSEKHLAHVDKMESEKDLVNQRTRRRRANLRRVVVGKLIPDDLTKHVMALQYEAHEKNIADLLEDAPMPVDFQDGSGNTLLHMAHLLGLSEIAEFLENEMLADKYPSNQNGYTPRDMRLVSVQIYYQMLPPSYHDLDKDADVFSAVSDGLANMRTLRSSSDSLHTQLTTTYQARLDRVESQLNWPIIGKLIHDGVALEQRKKFAKELVSLMEGKPFDKNSERSRLVCQEVEDYMQNLRGRFEKAPEKSQLYQLLQEFLTACEYQNNRESSLVSFRKYQPIPVSREDLKLQLAERDEKILRQAQKITSLTTENRLQGEELAQVKGKLQDTQDELASANEKIEFLMKWYEAEQVRKDAGPNKDGSNDEALAADTPKKYRGPGMY